MMLVRQLLWRVLQFQALRLIELTQVKTVTPNTMETKRDMAISHHLWITWG